MARVSRPSCVCSLAKLQKTVKVIVAKLFVLVGNDPRISPVKFGLNWAEIYNSRHLFCLDWTSATRPRWASQHIFSGSNRWWMQLLGWFFRRRNLSTSLRFFVNSIGWRYENGAVLVYKCLHGLAPPQLIDELCRPADLETRQRLRSASSSSLIVRRTRLSTVGDRAFQVAAARVWNNLPRHFCSFSSRLCILADVKV